MEDIILLDKKQLEMYNVLKCHSDSTNNWLTIKDLTEELSYKTDSQTRFVLKKLLETDGMAILSHSVKKGRTNVKTYGLSPEMLETIIRTTSETSSIKTDGINYSSLYIAEPAFGTKLFNHELTMKGLAFFLEVNKYAPSIQQVIFQGGVIPRVPVYSSKSNLDNLKLLGRRDRVEGEPKDSAELLLEENIANVWEQEFYEKHINNGTKKKITTLSDAFEVAHKQIQILMDVLPEDTILRIQYGEEDKENQTDMEQAYLAEWSKKKKDRIAHEGNELSDIIKKLSVKEYLTEVEKSFYNLFKSDLYLKKKDELKEDYKKRLDEVITDLASDYFEGFQDRFESTKMKKADMKSYAKVIANVSQNISSYLYWAGMRKNAKELVKKKVDELDLKLGDIISEKDRSVSKLNELKTNLTWVQQLLESGRSSITRFTRQYPVFADEVELLYKKAKDDYSNNFYKWTLGQHPLIHVTPRKFVKLKTGIPNIGTGKEFEEEIEFTNSKLGDKSVLLIHNLRHTLSNDVTPKDIHDAKLLMNYQNMVLKKFYKDQLDAQPDIVLMGHTTGGFRVQPWFKDTEHMIEGEFVKDQDISYLITMPTLQSIPKLESYRDKGFKNWHIKRYEKGSYASAAILHIEDSEKVNKFLVMDTVRLDEFGKIACEIDDLRAKFKDESDPEVKKAIKAQIKEKNKLVKHNFKKIEASGDYHLGAPDNKDRYSKYQFIEASQIYQREKGLPNILSWDEVLHGASFFFGDSSTNYAMRDVPFNDLLTLISEDTRLNEKQKLELMHVATMKDRRALTIFNFAVQKEDFRETLFPYAQEVLSKGGKIVLMSGNHFNQSMKLSDEATELAVMFDKELFGQPRIVKSMFDGSYRVEMDNQNAQIHVFEGKGNAVGAGSLRLENDFILYGMHKFASTTDEIYGIITHLRKMNNDADIVIAGDRHQPGAAYADGHLAVLHPGYQTINKYVGSFKVQKPAGLRGFNNVFYDPDKKGIYQVDFVLNPTLEKIVEEHKIH